jgi:hypothetical protein
MMYGTGHELPLPLLPARLQNLQSDEHKATTVLRETYYAVHPEGQGRVIACLTALEAGARFDPGSIVR